MLYIHLQLELTELTKQTDILGGFKNPDLPFLAFLEFLAFFLSQEFLAFFSVFPFFPRDFGGSPRIKILAFLVVFLAVFQKSKERKIREGFAVEPAGNDSGANFR